MWMEIKALLTVIGIIFIAIVIGQVFVYNIIWVLLLFMAIGIIVFGDIIIGYQISHNHVDVVIDPMDNNHELCIYCDSSGGIDFIKTKKGPFNTREFVKYKKEATIINDGRYQMRFINGNSGFIGHENYPENVNLDESEALDKLPGDDIKEIVDKLPLVRKIKEDKND